MLQRNSCASLVRGYTIVFTSVINSIDVEMYRCAVDPELPHELPLWHREHPCTGHMEAGRYCARSSAAQCFLSATLSIVTDLQRIKFMAMHGDHTGLVATCHAFSEITSHAPRSREPPALC